MMINNPDLGNIKIYPAEILISELKNLREKAIFLFVYLFLFIYDN